jgi:hypothetical protein
MVLGLKARPSHDRGLLPLPKGEGWGEGLQTIDGSEPPHPRPLRCGERESRHAAIKTFNLHHTQEDKRFGDI